MQYYLPLEINLFYLEKSHEIKRRVWIWMSQLPLGTGTAARRDEKGGLLGQSKVLTWPLDSNKLQYSLPVSVGEETIYRYRQHVDVDVDAVAVDLVKARSDTDTDTYGYGYDGLRGNRWRNE